MSAPRSPLCVASCWAAPSSPARMSLKMTNGCSTVSKRGWPKGVPARSGTSKRTSTPRYTPPA
eukprot:695483-Prymnesium_polylepis.1